MFPLALNFAFNSFHAIDKKNLKDNSNFRKPNPKIASDEGRTTITGGNHGSDPNLLFLVVGIFYLVAKVFGLSGVQAWITRRSGWMWAVRLKVQVAEVAKLIGIAGTFVFCVHASKAFCICQGRSNQTLTKMLPVCSLWMCLGKRARLRLCSNAYPSEAKLKLLRLSGSLASSKFWINRFPNFRLSKLLGKVTCSQLAGWKFSPKMISSKSSGKVTKRRSWLNSSPNFNLRKLAGNRTNSRPW